MTLVLEQASNSLTIYGPVSVEAVSDDNKLITMDAIERALPQIMGDPSNRVSVLHKDQLVGDVVTQATADPDKAPNEEARNLVEHLNQEFGGMKTGVYEATPEIAEAFPHLETRVGEPVFFAAAQIKGGNQTKNQVQQDVLNGNLDGFSLSGAPVEQETIKHCESGQCERVTRIEEMDLSAITLGSRTDGKQSPFAARVRNPGAAFQVVQQAGCCEACEDPDTAKLVEVVQGESLTDKVESCVKQLKADGHDQSSAIAICRDAINEAVQTLVDDAITYDDEDDEDEETKQTDPPGSDSKQSTETTMTQSDEPSTETESDSTADPVEEADESAEEILMELRNRLESLEEGLAEVRGQTEEADEDDEDDEEEVEVNVEEQDEDDDEDEDEEDGEEEQADPSTTESDMDLEQAIEDALEEKLEQANVAETPTPGAHTTEQDGNGEPSVDARLEQAIIAGDRNAMDSILIEQGVI